MGAVVGREATTVARWQGDVAEVKVLLESTEIILRGAIRARIPRAAITAVRCQDDTLIIDVGADQLKLELGPVETVKWADILLKPPPTLAEKLGISPDRPAFIVGTVDDPALSGALHLSTVRMPGMATALIAVLHEPDDLDAALNVAQRTPELPIWCLHGRGKQAAVTGTEVRTRLRAAGYIDNKISAVSEEWTATRYVHRA